MIKIIYAGNPANRRQYDFPAACQCVCGMYAIIYILPKTIIKVYQNYVIDFSVIVCHHSELHPSGGETPLIDPA